MKGGLPTDLLPLNFDRPYIFTYRVIDLSQPVTEHLPQTNSLEPDIVNFL